MKIERLGTCANSNTIHAVFRDVGKSPCVEIWEKGAFHLLTSASSLIFVSCFSSSLFKLRSSVPVLRSPTTARPCSTGKSRRQRSHYVPSHSLFTSVQFNSNSNNSLPLPYLCERGWRGRESKSYLNLNTKCAFRSLLLNSLYEGKTSFSPLIFSASASA
jgi:hypothetical protein